MKTMRFAFPVAFALVAGAIPIALEACGSSDVHDGSVPADGGATPLPDATTPAADTGAPPSSDAGGDASAPLDAPFDPDGPLNQVDANDTPDGGKAVTPGQIPCGAATCATPANQCCAQLDGGGSCAASNTTCPSGTGSVKCVEAADCVQGTVCCATASFTGVTASCTPACVGLGAYQLCRTNGECPNKDCTPQTCFGQRVEACGGVQAGCTK